MNLFKIIIIHLLASCYEFHETAENYRNSHLQDIIKLWVIELLVI